MAEPRAKVNYYVVSLISPLLVVSQKIKLENGQTVSLPASRNCRDQKIKHFIAEDGDLILIVGRECRILVASQVLSMASVVFRTMIPSQVVRK